MGTAMEAAFKSDNMRKLSRHDYKFIQETLWWRLRRVTAYLNIQEKNLWWRLRMDANIRPDLLWRLDR